MGAAMRDPSIVGLNDAVCRERARANAAEAKAEALAQSNRRLREGLEKIRDMPRSEDRFGNRLADQMKEIAGGALKDNGHG